MLFCCAIAAGCADVGQLQPALWAGALRETCRGGDSACRDDRRADGCEEEDEGFGELNCADATQSSQGSRPIVSRSPPLAKLP